MDKTDIRQELKTRGQVTRTTIGTSMNPLLIERETLVDIRTYDSDAAPQVGDMVLFQRENQELVIHRILELRDGNYYIQGDNCAQGELVYPQQILGYVKSYYKNGWKELTSPEYLSYRSRIMKRMRWRNHKATILYILQESKHFWGAILCSLLCSIAISLCDIGMVLLMKKAIDAIVGANPQIFYLQMLLLLVAVILQVLARTVNRCLEEHIRSGVENHMKQSAYDALLHQPYERSSHHHSAELLHCLTSDTAVVADAVATILPGLTAMLVKMTGAFILLLYLAPQFAFLLMGAGAGMLLFSTLFRKYIKHYHRQVQKEDGKLKAFLQESLEHLLVILTFQGENEMLHRANQHMTSHRQARIRKNRFSSLCNMGFLLAMEISYLLGLFWCGLGILHHKISYGTLMATLRLISQLESPLGNITAYIPKYYTALASAERLQELKSASYILPLPSSCNLYEKMQQLHLQNLSFSYPDSPQKVIFTDLSLVIEKGDFVAITGESGIGKSTLLKLLMGMYLPTTGKIYIKGHTSSHTVDHSTRSLFGYVPQGNQLLSGTIREAITCFGPQNLSESDQLARIQNCLQIACCDYVNQLPLGLDTPVLELGAGLSEGQAQRLAIARALYVDAPILLLDEATSALDAQLELRLLHNLKKMTDKTVILVTHRPAALQLCDKEIKL